MRNKPIEIRVDNKQAMGAIKEVVRELEKVKQAANATGLSDFMKWQTNKVNHLKSKQKKAAKIIATQKITIDDLSKELSYCKQGSLKRCNPCRDVDRVNPNRLPSGLHIIGEGDTQIGFFRKYNEHRDKRIR